MAEDVIIGLPTVSMTLLNQVANGNTGEPIFID